MLLWDLNDVKRLFQSIEGVVIGVGINAFSRIAPSFFIPAYGIVSLRHTTDLPILKSQCSVFCLEKQKKATLPNYKTSKDLLYDPIIKQYLNSWGTSLNLLLYQNYFPLLELSSRQRWKLLANPPDMRIIFGDREKFLKIASDLGLRTIPGGTYGISKLFDNDYHDWKRNIGPKFVCQLPEIKLGGGKGTFYINSEKEYERLLSRLQKRKWRGIKLNRISIHKYIKGVSASMAICITRQGILKGPVQIQLIDLPYCRNVEEKGIFCGHYWAERLWSDSQEKEAKEAATSIANYMASLGYRGIMGVDFIMDSEGKSCFFQEINPRLTGAFPFLSFLHMEKGLIPLEAFHILEFLDIPYRIDIQALNEAYEARLSGGHVLIFALEGLRKETINLRSGVYEIDFQRMKLISSGQGINYSAIKADNQVVVIGGPPCNPLKGLYNDPLFRVCHVMFRDALVMGDKNNIKEKINSIAKLIHSEVFNIQSE